MCAAGSSLQRLARRLVEGKVHCAVVLDVWSRRVIGWSIDGRPSTALVTNALGMAIDQGRPSGSTIIHSDQGTQLGFTSWAFTRRALDSGLLPSMGSVGDCFDNAVVESDAGGVARPKTMADARRAFDRDLRLPRDLSQSPAPPLVAKYADAGRVRGSPSANDSSMNPRTRLHRSQDAPEPLSKTQAAQGMMP